MRTTRPLRLLGFIAILASAALALPAPAAHADTITISPPEFELFGNPGDVVSEKLKVRNDGTNDVVYQTDVEDFQAAGDLGDINLIEDPNAPRTTYSLAKWMTVDPSRFSVPAGQEKVVDITIHIPKDAEPGGHYASVQIRLSGTPVAGGGASVESRLNSLVLLRVSGDITEKLVLDSFRTDTNYYKSGPIDFALKTTNQGNVHVAPTGTIVITDMFGRKVKEIPLKVANVLPGASRLVTTTWTDQNMVGRFTATLQATYGQSQKQTLLASTTFIVFPPSLIAVIIVIILLLILLFTQRRRLKKALHALTSE